MGFASGSLIQIYDMVLKVHYANEFLHSLLCPCPLPSRRCRAWQGSHHAVRAGLRARPLLCARPPERPIRSLLHSLLCPCPLPSRRRRAGLTYAVRAGLRARPRGAPAPRAPYSFPSPFAVLPLPALQPPPQLHRPPPVRYNPRTSRPLARYLVSTPRSSTATTPPHRAPWPALPGVQEAGAT